MRTEQQTTDRSKAVVCCGSLLPVFGVSFGDVSPYVCSYYF